jgi:hypothetical protein
MDGNLFLKDMDVKKNASLNFNAEQFESKK